MANFKLIIPRATQNLNDDPTFALGADGWSGNVSQAAGSAPPFLGTATRRFVIGAADTYICTKNYTFPTTAGVYFASAWIWVPAATADWSSGNIQLQLANASGDTTTQIRTWTDGTDPREEWFLIVMKIQLGPSDVVADLRIRNIDAGVADDYIEVGAVQLEEQSDSYTTLCIGNLPGCYWEGPENASNSFRLATASQGGVVLDLEDDLGLVVEKFGGAGFPEFKNIFRNMAQVDGREFLTTKMGGANIVLRANLSQTSLSTYHAARQDLVAAMRPSHFGGAKAFTLQYHGAGDIKEIRVRLDSGLDISKTNGFHEDMMLRFVSESPFWARPGFYGFVLDGNATDSSGGILRRSGTTVRDTAASIGKWDDLGLTNTSHTTFGAIYDILFDKRDSIIYVAGDFTGFAGVTGADYVAKYTIDDGAGTWGLVGAANSFNNIARSMGIRPEGGVYIGGDFTNVSGDADADGIVSWDGTSLVAVPSDTGTATSTSASIFRAIKVGKDGKIFVGGGFIGLAGTGASGFAYWDPDTDDWTSPGAAYPTSVNDLAVLPNGHVIVPLGANTMTAVDGTANGIGRFDGTSLYIMGSGLGGTDVVHAVFADTNGDVYIGGSITSAGGITVNNVAKWNGSAWSALGEGIDDTVYAITRVGNDIIFGGLYDANSAAGGMTTPSAISYAWDGSGWRQLDAHPGTSGTVQALESFEGNLLVGFDEVQSSIYYNDVVQVTTKGTANAYPKVIITNNETPNNPLRIVSIRNETTGQGLYFNKKVLANETLTIDLSPGDRSMTSSIFGRDWSVLPSSDITEFYIRPGVTNYISCYYHYENSFDNSITLSVPSVFWGVD
jgi:hypothetical protein